MRIAYQSAFTVQLMFLLGQCMIPRGSRTIILVHGLYIVASFEVVGHVPDELAQVLFPLLTSGKRITIKCHVTGVSRAAEQGFWVPGGRSSS